jgi:three-Cys-motif partner protein
MATTTQIEWTDTTWNPVTGCTKITHGCDFCYAERFSERFRGVSGHPFENGFDLTLRPDRLRQPLRWREPRRVFVNSMSDLFHKEVPKSFIDSVFMIAISVLLDAQKQYRERTGVSRRIRCFFSETDPDAFAQLERTVALFHKPAEGFEIKTHCGKFEDAISDIQTFIGRSFPLIFIDPTGWTGYPFEKIKPLFARPKCEVLINFMYAFVQRFVHSDDEATVTSLGPILGGPGWRDRLDTSLSRGPATEKLFRDTLKSVGNFDFVVSTKIDKATTDRPHFFITYCTKSLEGLKVFRQTEYDALRQHEKSRANARERVREERTNTLDMFAGLHARAQGATIDEIVKEQMQVASAHLVTNLAKSGPRLFSDVLVSLLQAYMLRETNVKDICVDLGKAGKIENTWGIGNRKPRDECLIKLAGSAA